jgi:phage recombination protein Bet
MSNNTALSTQAQPRASALAVMANRLNVDPSKLHGTLKATVFKGATDEELLALVVVANEYRLNPLTKEIYAFPAKGGGIVPVVSVDGWVSMVNDHPQMDGLEFEHHREEDGKLVAVTCRIYRKDRSRPIEVTEYLSECRRNTEPWKMENRMLRHKTLMQCARYAFGFSGVTDEEEAAETPAMRNATGKVVTEEKVIDPFATKPDPIPSGEATLAKEDLPRGEENPAAQPETLI